MTDSAKKTELETSNQVYFLQLKAVDLFPYFFRAGVSPLGGQQIGPVEVSCSDQATANCCSGVGEHLRDQADLGKTMTHVVGNESCSHQDQE